MRRQSPLAAGRALVAVACCVVLAGCASTTLVDRPWVQVETRHYEIISSLDADDTAALAREIELFRMAVEYLAGHRIPAAPVRTRLFAFDDRGLGSKFGRRGRSGYLLPRLRGDLIVLRAGGGWDGDATIGLKLEYARRLLRSAGSLELPPWYDEGLAQVASTLAVRGHRVDLGILREDHVRLLRGSPWIDVDRLLRSRDLSGWSQSDRDMFDAESWALVHYLVVDETDGGRERVPALLSGKTPTDAGAIERSLYRHVRAKEFRSFSISFGAHGDALRAESRGLTRDELLGQLGWLSIALSKPEQARSFFDAVSTGPPAAGIAAASVLEADWASADEWFQTALAASPEAPHVLLDRGNAERERAAASDDAVERLHRVAAARRYLEESRDLDGTIPETHAALAATYLVDGQDAASGLGAIELALGLLPASLPLRLVQARLQLAAGSPGTARREAIEIITRSRSADTTEAARRLLERVDARHAPAH